MDALLPSSALPDAATALRRARRAGTRRGQDVANHRPSERLTIPLLLAAHVFDAVADREAAAFAAARLAERARRL